MDEDAIIERVRAGEADAFRALVERYERPIFAIVRSRGLGREAEDLAQEIFLRAYRALPDYEAGRGFAAWLYTIARNRCTDAWRRRKAAADLAVEPTGFDPLPDDLTPRLQEALAALPAERRIAFELVDVYGLSLEDAALIEDVAVGTIKSRRHRAREALRETLQPEWEA